MFETLAKFAEMRQQDRASMLRDFDLWPNVDLLITMERKYGDALTFEDMNGFKKKKKKTRNINKEGSNY